MRMGHGGGVAEILGRAAQVMIESRSFQLNCRYERGVTLARGILKGAENLRTILPGVPEVREITNAEFACWRCASSILEQRQRPVDRIFVEQKLGFEQPEFPIPFGGGLVLPLPPALIGGLDRTLSGAMATASPIPNTGRLANALPDARNQPGATAAPGPTSGSSGIQSNLHPRPGILTVRPRRYWFGGSGSGIGGRRWIHRGVATTSAAASASLIGIGVIKYVMQDCHKVLSGDLVSR